MLKGDRVFDLLSLQETFYPFTCVRPCLLFRKPGVWGVLPAWRSRPPGALAGVTAAVTWRHLLSLTDSSSTLVTDGRAQLEWPAVLPERRAGRATFRRAAVIPHAPAAPAQSPSRCQVTVSSAAAAVLVDLPVGAREPLESEAASVADHPVWVLSMASWLAERLFVFL